MPTSQAKTHTVPRKLVRLTPAGQISIPKGIREALGVIAGDVFAVEQDGGAVVFRPQSFTDREGREAYLEAKADEQAGRLRGPYSTVAEDKAAAHAGTKRRRKR